MGRTHQDPDKKSKEQKKNRKELASKAAREASATTSVKRETKQKPGSKYKSSASDSETGKKQKTLQPKKEQKDHDRDPEKKGSEALVDRAWFTKTEYTEEEKAKIQNCPSFMIRAIDKKVDRFDYAIRINNPTSIPNGISRKEHKRLSAIRKSQLSNSFAIPKASFDRLARQIATEVSSDSKGVRFTKKSLLALRMVTEKVMVEIMQNSNLVAISSGRVTLAKKHMNLALMIDKSLSKIRRGMILKKLEDKETMFDLV